MKISIRHYNVTIAPRMFKSKPLTWQSLQQTNELHYVSICLVFLISDILSLSLSFSCTWLKIPRLSFMFRY